MNVSLLRALALASLTSVSLKGAWQPLFRDEGLITDYKGSYYTEQPVSYLAGASRLPELPLSWNVQTWVQPISGWEVEILKETEDWLYVRRNGFRRLYYGTSIPLFPPHPPIGGDPVYEPNVDYGPELAYRLSKAAIAANASASVVDSIVTLSHHDVTALAEFASDDFRYVVTPWSPVPEAWPVVEGFDPPSSCGQLFMVPEEGDGTGEYPGWAGLVPVSTPQGWSLLDVEHFPKSGELWVAAQMRDNSGQLIVGILRSPDAGTSWETVWTRSVEEPSEQVDYFPLRYHLEIEPDLSAWLIARVPHSNDRNPTLIDYGYSLDTGDLQMGDLLPAGSVRRFAVKGAPVYVIAGRDGTVMLNPLSGERQLLSSKEASKVYFGDGYFLLDEIDQVRKVYPDSWAFEIVDFPDVLEIDIHTAVGFGDWAWAQAWDGDSLAIFASENGTDWRKLEGFSAFHGTSADPVRRSLTSTPFNWHLKPLQGGAALFGKASPLLEYNYYSGDGREWWLFVRETQVHNQSVEVSDLRIKNSQLYGQVYYTEESPETTGSVFRVDQVRWSGTEWEVLSTGTWPEVYYGKNVISAVPKTRPNFKADVHILTDYLHWTGEVDDPYVVVRTGWHAYDRIFDVSLATFDFWWWPATSDFSVGGDEEWSGESNTRFHNGVGQKVPGMVPGTILPVGNRVYCFPKYNPVAFALNQCFIGLPDMCEYVVELAAGRLAVAQDGRAWLESRHSMEKWMKDFWPADADHSEWYRSPVFGFVETSQYPRLYHWNHGWIEWFEDPAGSWTYKDSVLGWVTTSAKFYPYLYSWNTRDWMLYYKSSTTPNRWFYDYKSRGWIAEGAFAKARL